MVLIPAKLCELQMVGRGNINSFGSQAAHRHRTRTDGLLQHEAENTTGTQKREDETDITTRRAVFHMLEKLSLW